VLNEEKNMMPATPTTTADVQETLRKGHWVEPSVSRIDVGAAEAGDGSGPDAGFNPS
jgi:hypothetical protein